MTLFHFSEDPNIRVFEPRPSRPIAGVTNGEPLVWAIDEWHSPMYFFPRDCPRVMLWALPASAPVEIAQWIGQGDWRMAAYVESSWLGQIESYQLYRYSFDDKLFMSINDAGMHVCRDIVEPVAIEPMGRLMEHLLAANVDLRPVETLQPFADARLWESTLHFSGIRLKNAREWVVPV